MRPIFYRRPTINGRGIVRRWSRACRCCGTPWQGPVTLWLSSSIGSKAPRRGSLVGGPPYIQTPHKKTRRCHLDPQNRRFANGHPGCLDAVAASSVCRIPRPARRCCASAARTEWRCRLAKTVVGGLRWLAPWLLPPLGVQTRRPNRAKPNQSKPPIVTFVFGYVCFVLGAFGLRCCPSSVIFQL